MRIEQELKLGFKDVLFRPKRSTLKSRSQVELTREFTFKHSGRQWSGTPVIAANMDSVGSFAMAKALSEHGVMTAIHKHYTVEDWAGFNPSTSLTAEGPAGNALVEMDLLVADIDTGASRTSLNLTSVMLSSPISVNGNFAIEIDANAFIVSEDTLGIAADDGSNDMSYTFQRYSNGHYWGTTKSFYNGSVGNNMAIFAVVGDNNVGINDNEFYNGVQLSAGPNPATVETTMSFNLGRSFKNVKVNVMDANGRIVNRIEKGALAAGLYNEVMEVSSLSAGTYYYTIYADNTKLTKSFNVVK